MPRLEPEFVSTGPEQESRPEMTLQQAPIIDEHHLFTEPLHELEKYLEGVTGMASDPTGSKYLPKKDSTPKQAYDGRRIASAIETLAEPMMTHVGDSGSRYCLV